MCGIAGWIDFNENLKDKEKVIANMQKTMMQRGPDAEGIYITQNAAILHRRLIVVDPENGRQPMRRNKGEDQYIITYNGELYNTEELRTELLEKSYIFEGHSDTEVLLAAFAEWGEDCVQKLNGIYAFGVWNETKQSLCLVRDRIGVKPLFFYEYNGGLIFGSEIKALLANPKVKPVLTKEGVNEIFLLGPGRTSGCGVFRDIKELCPGQLATFDKDGLRVKTYWSLKAREHTDNLNQTIDKTRFLITDAVKRQLVSDVPLCCFLSGGLDSSIISKIAADEYAASGKKLTTYSVDYQDNQKYFTKNRFQPDDDALFIQIMSKAIDSSHNDVILDNEALANALEEAVCARDLPGMTDIDSSLLLFCREIKKDFTVSVSGECADEIFGGYPWYHNEEILFENTFPWSRSIALRKSLLQDGVLGADAEDYVRDRYHKTVLDTDSLPTDTRLEKRMREMFMLNFNWFMQTLLDRKDRMSMYSGLEVRVPFCDYRLVEYAYNMPWELKSLNGREKGIVREAMKGMLPDEILWRKKSPYPKTQNPLYFEIVKKRVFDLMQDKTSFLSQFIDKTAIENLAENPDSIKDPWYGQLMRTPQIFAYLLQVEYWMQKYKPSIG